MTESSDTARFLGTWQLLESYSERASGRLPFPLGAKVIGRINYDRAGNMAAQLMGEDRPPFKARDPREIRVSRPGHFSPSPSLNRTGTSQLIRLPSSSRRDKSHLPMHERTRRTFSKPTKRPCRTDHSACKAFVLALHPAHQIIIHAPP